MVKKAKIAISKYAKQNRRPSLNHITSPKANSEPETPSSIVETHYAFIEQSFYYSGDELYFAGDVHKIMVMGENSKRIIEVIANDYDYIKYRDDFIGSWQRYTHTILNIDGETINESNPGVEYQHKKGRGMTPKFIRYMLHANDLCESFIIIFPASVNHNDMDAMIRRALYHADLSGEPISAGFFGSGYYGESITLNLHVHETDNMFRPDPEVLKIDWKYKQF